MKSLILVALSKQCQEEWGIDDVCYVSRSINSTHSKKIEQELDRKTRETRSGIHWQHCLIAKWCLCNCKLQQWPLGIYDVTHKHKPWHSHTNVCLVIHTLYSFPSVSIFHLPHKTPFTHSASSFTPPILPLSISIPWSGGRMKVRHTPATAEVRYCHLWAIQFSRLWQAGCLLG